MNKLAKIQENINIVKQKMVNNTKGRRTLKIVLLCCIIILLLQVLIRREQLDKFQLSNLIIITRVSTRLKIRKLSQLT